MWRQIHKKQSNFFFFKTQISYPGDVCPNSKINVFLSKFTTTTHVYFGRKIM